MSSMIKEIEERKKIKILKATFTKLTMCESWQEAARKFPSHAREERLSMFTGTYVTTRHNRTGHLKVYNSSVWHSLK